MSNISKIYCISYASRQYENRKNTFTSLAKNCNLFNDFKCFTEDDIDLEFKEKHKDVWNQQKGGGYWIWKSYIIHKNLQEINNNDILIYLDVGCHINITEESIKRFNEYIDMVNNSKSGFLRFQIPHKEKDYTNQYTYN